MELKPCPFCGGEAYIEQVGTSRHSTIYECGSCGCRLETGEEFNHGSRWNERPQVDELRARADAYAIERDHAKSCYDRTVRLLTGIHALLYPPRFTDNDGRTWQFKSPLAEEQMQELSDRIRALPDEIASIEDAMKAGAN